MPNKEQIKEETKKIALYIANAIKLGKSDYDYQNKKIKESKIKCLERLNLSIQIKENSIKSLKEKDNVTAKILHSEGELSGIRYAITIIEQELKTIIR